MHHKFIFAKDEKRPNPTLLQQVLLQGGDNEPGWHCPHSRACHRIWQLTQEARERMEAVSRSLLIVHPMDGTERLRGQLRETSQLRLVFPGKVLILVLIRELQ